MAQKPVVGMHSLMEAVRVGANGNFGLIQVHGAFMPPESLYTGQAEYVRLVHCVLLEGTTELQRWPMLVQPTQNVFTVIRPGGTPVNHAFTEPGAYELRFELKGHGTIGRLPFTVEVADGGDPFKPEKLVQTSGPWSRLAALSIHDPDGERGQVRFRVWMRGGADAVDGASDDVSVRVVHNGDTIYESRPKLVTASALQWRELDVDLKFLQGGGGDVVRAKDLLKQDGNYDVVVGRDDTVYGVYRFVVEGGRLRPHPRSAFDGPAGDQLLPRLIGLEGSGSELLYWAERMTGDEAAAAASAQPTAIAGPTAEQRERWTVRSRADRGRPFEVVVTRAAARMDASIAVGDEVIAFGTGSNKGVSFLRVGEDTEQTLPNGQEYSSKLFAVAGRKLVLTKGKQVVVFDTDTATTTEIPLTDITLSKVSGGLYRANPIVASGMLVATINDPQDVTDRTLVKVIDLSSAEPVIVAIANPDLRPNELTTVAVDPAGGTIVLTSERKGLLFAAPIAAGARFRVYDLTGHDGIHRDAVVHVADGKVAYMDTAGSARFRLLDLESGAVEALGAMGRTRPYYALGGGRYAFATKPNSGSAYSIHVGDVGGEPMFFPGTGDDGPQRTGNLGMGESVALVPGGHVFLAGEGGLGSGEVLQVGGAAGWAFVAGADGAPIAASDVVGGDLLVAFKTGSRNDVTIGYCRFGDAMAAAGIRVVE